VRRLLPSASNERLICYVLAAAFTSFLQQSDGLTQEKSQSMWWMDWLRFWMGVALQVVLVWRAFIDQSLMRYDGHGGVKNLQHQEAGQSHPQGASPNPQTVEPRQASDPAQFPAASRSQP